MIDKQNSNTYKWGDNCDSWVFVDKENLSVKMESMPSRTKEKLHFHSNAQQFFFILKGTATFYIENKSESINENQGILIDPKTEHHIANETELNLEFLVISQPSTNHDRINVEEDSKISVREMKESDFELIANYFTNLNPDFLLKMGIDIDKLPSKSQLIEKLQSEYEKPNEQKKIYYTIWQIDDCPIGHSNINDIDFGQSAFMHLHIWENKKRKSGLGAELVKRTLPFYFKNFRLEKLMCEPKAENIAPNKTLKKVGFELVKNYETIPGWLNFKQMVNRYELSKERFLKF